MKTNHIRAELQNLQLSGDVYTDTTHRLLYATDASAYREEPVAVTCPKTQEDVRRIIAFAASHEISVIPRAAGTSLAGQVVGPGIVLDVSRYMDSIPEVNPEERWVRVQPGVNLDELNMYLKPYGLFFAPETSTSNRCRIGGMFGNNSCGAHSVVYGSTREHVLEATVILSNGKVTTFGPLSAAEFEEKCLMEGLEGAIYRKTRDILSEPENQQAIRNEYPDPSNPRKNTGYALDILLETAPFTDTGEPFNFCKLLAGSEGTLAFTTEIKLNLEPLPPENKALVCAHFNSIDEALRANLIALEHKPEAVELMDDTVLGATKANHEQRKNRFFVKGNPKAILIAEFARHSQEEIDRVTGKMTAAMQQAGYGYHYPVVKGDDINKVWNLRKSGLGALANVPGDKKSVTVIEDTSVKVDRLPDYIREFQDILEQYSLKCVYHAHVGSGELHLRPMLNLKNPGEVALFERIAYDVARLVKKYRGSLSGEHGDGRLRGQFIPLMLGDRVYGLLKELKHTWDPHGIFNPGKITNTPPITENLRYTAGKIPGVQTFFAYPEYGGFVQAVERCNGSGDCRKSAEIGGTMCPSYMATREEKDTTRARANILREMLANPDNKKLFDHKEIYQVLDLCLSCKACKSECPASVDMAKLKAEFLQHYYDIHGIPFRSRAIAHIDQINRLGSYFPRLTNFFMQNPVTSKLLKRRLGFAEKRSLPSLSPKPLSRWQKRHQHARNEAPTGRVYLFNDEFTNYNDTDIGIKAILLLTRLGYEVTLPRHTVSGRASFSKGLLRDAAKKASKNVQALRRVATEETPLIGIEPSAILSFRDEYPDIVPAALREDANHLAKHSFMFEEFIAREIAAGRISADSFTDAGRKVLLHGHCQQKAVATTQATREALSLPQNYKVEEIPSGCCGMAGSFGYEEEHYELSMQIGELVLFPAVRAAAQSTLIAAPGTSCRHQIKDGTKRTALHPVEVLYHALRSGE